MSIAGVIRYRGVMFDAYRPGKTDGEGGTTVITWPALPVIRSGRVFLQVIADELAQTIFGREAKVDLRGTVLPEPIVAKDDGLVVRSGPYSGQRFRVTAVAPQEHRPGSAHHELALERTTETFG